MGEKETVWNIWSRNELAVDVIDAGYKFVSAGRWYALGTEAVLLFNITYGDGCSGDKSELEILEHYIKTGNSNFSGMFGGWCEKDPTLSYNYDNTSYSTGWDEEGSGYNEFDIYKNGVLVRKATKGVSE